MADADGGEPRKPRGSLIAELGLTAEIVDGDIHGTAIVSPAMLIPGSDCLRTSLLVAWADTLIGFQAIAAVAPLVPVTVDLAIDLHRLPRGVSGVTAQTRVLKAGSSVLTAEIDFAADGTSIGAGAAAFMVEPSQSFEFPPMEKLLTGYSRGMTVLDEPYAERSGCVRESPGVASLPLTRDKFNAARSINGGLIAVVIEEAILSAAPGTSLSSLAVRYLRAGRVGPFIATAEIQGDVARVEVIDEGKDHRLVVAATGRTAALDD